jgi:hypothetical protein
MTVQTSAASHLGREDYNAIRDALLAWREDGVANPLIPSDVDIDGDGTTDAYGLDANDEVIFVKSAKLKDTVFEAVGGSIETGGDI